MPSKAVAAAEERAKLNISRDVASKIANLTLVLEPNGFRPMLFVTTKDDDGAKTLQEKWIPTLTGLFFGQPDPDKVRTTEVKVLGQKLRSISLPSSRDLLVGREGTTLVLGLDGNSVAGGVVNASKQEGLLADKKIADAIKDFDGSIMTGTASLGQLLVAMMTEMEKPRRVVEVRPIGPPGVPPPPPEKPVATEESKALKELRKAVAPIPPAVFALTRKEGTLALEVRCNDLKKVSATLINALVESALELSVKRYGGGFQTIGPEPVKPDVPPPPPPKE
jgi:hypothetical protein